MTALRLSHHEYFEIVIIYALPSEYNAISLVFDKFWDDDENSNNGKAQSLRLNSGTCLDPVNWTGFDHCPPECQADTRTPQEVPDLQDLQHSPRCDRGSDP